jgi:hypothetical protein
MKKIGALVSALLLSGNALAMDGVAVEYGNGDSTDMARASVLWNWDREWFADGDWVLTGFWEASLGSWRGKSATGNNQTITDIGFTPVFRLQQKKPEGLAPYLEGAIGFHLITPTFIYANRQLGSSFQFGDHLGVGVRFGDSQQFDVAYRYQHISNGGIKQPNQGINFSQVRFTYHF